MNQVEQFIKKMSKLLDSDHYYLNGGCWKFFEILRREFPKADPYHSSKDCHVITKIDDEFYDVRGKVIYEAHYFPMVRYDLKKAHRWKM